MEPAKRAKVATTEDVKRERAEPMEEQDVPEVQPVDREQMPVEEMHRADKTLKDEPQDEDLQTAEDSEEEDEEQQIEGTNRANYREASPSTPDPVGSAEPSSNAKGSSGKRGRKASQPFPPAALPVLAAFLTALKKHNMPRSQEQVAAGFLWAHSKAMFKDVGGDGAAPAKKEIKDAVRQIKKPGGSPEGAADDSIVAAAEAAAKVIKQRQTDAEAWPSAMEELLNKHHQQLKQLVEQQLEKQKQLCQKQQQELLEARKAQFAKWDE